MLLPADVVLTLVRTGTLADSDFIGKKTYTLADGSELKSARFILREMRTGSFTLSNVVARIGPVEGGLLLGQSFLSRFDLMGTRQQSTRPDPRSCTTTCYGPVERGG